MLDMIKRDVPQGNVQAVLDAMDAFVRAGKGMLINIGDAKSGLVESVIAECKPMVSKPHDHRRHSKSKFVC